MIERFFSTRYFELLSQVRFERTDEARAAAPGWIDAFHSPERRHSTIGNTSPIKYALAWQLQRTVT